MFVAADQVSDIVKQFKDKNYDVEEADAVWIPLPEAQQQLDGSSDQARKIQKLIDNLEALDHVTAVYSNVIFDP